MLVLCHAEKVEIHCSVGTVVTELSCRSYTVKSGENRAVAFVGPAPANNGLVTSISLLHPSSSTFIAEIFSTFPNLQILSVIVDGTARLSQYTFRYAENLVELDINPYMLFDPLDDFVFIGANRLEKLTLNNVIVTGDCPFYGLTNLVSLAIYYEANIRPISNTIFNPLTKLKNINVQFLNLKKIPATLFAYNLLREKISIWDNVEAVESTFIDHLLNLKSIGFFGDCAHASWSFPNPISEFHSAMAPCYANYIN